MERPSPLPSLIEILPLEAPVCAEVTVPGSKSLTNRALVLAALAEGTTVLDAALWSEDTQIMVAALRQLGIDIRVAPDPGDSSNRQLTVSGRGGRIADGGTPGQPLALWVGNAGTAARFLAALVSLGHGAYRLEGVPRMQERPQGGLFQALRQLGVPIDSPKDRLPAVIHADGPRPGHCTVGVDDSSQFASALLLMAPAAGWEVRVAGENPEEMPYIEMTRQLIRAFPRRGGRFTIEADASSGSYFHAAGTLVPGSRIRVARWPESGWQVDERFPKYLPLPRVISRARDLGDSILTAMPLALLGPEPVRFTDLGRLRLQECERVAAMRQELSRCGGRVEESGDTLTIHPSAASWHGATVETHGDHRMAMSLAILGLKLPGLRIQNPACVRKTFPTFFQKLAAAPPIGLGAVIRDGQTGRPLAPDELMAESRPRRDGPADEERTVESCI
ncbi:MAG TPA: 3-phosphoshikimate 1-carboxyvinyltransferase [Verrucomicrobiota bacterium]|nr:3-phosphoshikimate 1-carboxyvinyltransferase [Verrucomicrobiota bacterium]HNU51131.1 3-phosphoshikimate 1-carboxyvinyltransferase [Verrucomicrobiota bacterium]